MSAMSLLVLSVLSSSPAEAGKTEVFEKVDASKVTEMIRSQGGQVVQETDSAGDPIIKVDASGFKYQVLFYECEGTVCGTMQFRAWWKNDGSVKVDEVNLYNVENRQGRAYMDKDNDPTFEMLLDMAGGVTFDHVREKHAQYRRSAERFTEKVINK